MFRSRSQFSFAVPPKTQAVYFLRGRSRKATRGSRPLEANPDIASSPSGDPPRHHFIVHDANPAWGIAESDDRRLQSTGIHLGHSRNEFYKSRVLPINTGVADEIDRYLCARKERKQPALQIRHSSGTLRGVAERIVARASATPSPPASEMRYRHSQRKAATDSGLSAQFCRECSLALVPNRRRCRSQAPLAATYLGHGSALSTHYYLHFIELLRGAASNRFATHHGELVSPLPRSSRRRG